MDNLGAVQVEIPYKYGEIGESILRLNSLDQQICSLSRVVFRDGLEREDIGANYTPPRTLEEVADHLSQAIENHTDTLYSFCYRFNEYILGEYSNEVKAEKCTDVEMMKSDSMAENSAYNRMKTSLEKLVKAEYTIESLRENCYGEGSEGDSPRNDPDIYNLAGFLRNGSDVILRYAEHVERNLMQIREMVDPSKTVGATLG